MLYLICAFSLILFWELDNTHHDKYLEACLGDDIFYGLNESTMQNYGNGNLGIYLKSPRKRPQGIPHLLLCYHSTRDYVMVRRATVMLAMRIHKSTSWVYSNIFLALIVPAVCVSALYLCGAFTMYAALKQAVTSLGAFLSPPVAPRAEDRPARMDARHRTIGALACLSGSFLLPILLAPLIDRGDDFVKLAFLFSVASSTALALAIRFFDPRLDMDVFVTIAAVVGRHLRVLPLVECAPLGLALSIVPWLEEYYTIDSGHGSNDGSHQDGVKKNVTREITNQPAVGAGGASPQPAGANLEIKDTPRVAPRFSFAQPQTRFNPRGWLVDPLIAPRGGGRAQGGLGLESNAQQMRGGGPRDLVQPIVVQGFVVPQDPVAPQAPVVGAKRGAIDIDSEVLHPRRRARRGVAGAGSNREPIDWTKVVARSERLKTERPGITNAICVEELLREGVIGPNQRARVLITLDSRANR
jgi:hypothetical protein